MQKTTTQEKRDKVAGITCTITQIVQFKETNKISQVVYTTRLENNCNVIVSGTTRPAGVANDLCGRQTVLLK